MQAHQLLLIDIETVPAFEHYDQLPETMQRLWDKKSELLAPEQSPHETYAERAGIFAEFGKIICIGLGYFYSEGDQPNVKTSILADKNEYTLLQRFTVICNQFFQQPQKLFCGHNIREFDLPYICRRLLIHSLPLPAGLISLQSKKPWENPVLDTMQYWKFGEYKSFASVALLSAVLNIPTPKDDIDGSEVAAVYWKEKDLARIISYCRKDVVTVAQLYLRLQGQPLLEPAQIHVAE